MFQNRFCLFPVCLTALQAQQQQKPTKSPGKLHAAARSASSNDVESSAAAADAKDENTTIRRLRKSNAELTTTVTQLKSKVRVLEGERDRAVRQVCGTDLCKPGNLVTLGKGAISLRFSPANS